MPRLKKGSEGVTCKRRDAVRLAQSEPARPAGAAFGALSGASVSWAAQRQFMPITLLDPWANCRLTYARLALQACGRTAEPKPLNVHSACWQNSFSKIVLLRRAIRADHAPKPLRTASCQALEHWAMLMHWTQCLANDSELRATCAEASAASRCSCCRFAARTQLEVSGIVPTVDKADGAKSCLGQVRPTARWLSCTARACVPKPKRHAACLHVRRAMQAA